MNPKRRRILIIKLGYAETLDLEVSQTVSLGDVFRTTVLLHLYRNDHVTWLTAPSAQLLLANNPLIDRLLVGSPEMLSSLSTERFDLIINLERDPEICSRAEILTTSDRCGFQGTDDGRIVACNSSAEALAMASDEMAKKGNLRNWCEILYQVVGAQWAGEEYVLGYTPSSTVDFDLGFNIHVGPKWPIKAWPQDRWTQLESLLGGRYTITHQSCLHDLLGYIDWIHSCRLLVTNDSLGLHLALALGKSVVALFGPTSSHEIHFWGRGIALHPQEDLPCLPCFQSTCSHNVDTCLEYIQPERVADAISTFLVLSSRQ
ncbi:MAG: glycosyltransferase family 9 protein [Planctomycetota bacterium]|jgi:heptosyltransferase-2|nr:glycosyltransferase family 9 protein [Planctomycetota bacterium]